MKKKYGLILLILGLILLVFGIMFGFINIGDDYKIKKYDFIKSHNMDKKTRALFPIFDSFVANDIYNDDFTRSYINDEGLYLSAFVMDKEVSLEKYIAEQLDKVSLSLKNDNKKIDSKDVECNFTCKRYKIYDNEDNLITDELKIYIEPSSNEVFEISYSSEKEELSNKLINKIIDNIKTDNEAKYKLGTINNNKLNIDLKISSNKVLSIVLDSDQYKEIEDRNNSERVTIVTDDDSKSVLALTIRYNNTDKTFDEFINNFYNYDGEVVKGQEIQLEKLLFYKYSINEKLYYVHIIDDKCALVIEVKGEMIYTKDFDNMIVKNID